MSIKIFDMSCTHGHRFEAWFSSLEDCDGQLARGLVVCPYCETSDVKRMPTAAHIGADVSASEDADRTVSAQESVVREAAERFFAVVRKAAESAVDVGGFSASGPGHVPRRHAAAPHQRHVHKKGSPGARRRRDRRGAAVGVCREDFELGVFP